MIKKTITAEVPIEVYHKLMDFAVVNEQSLGDALAYISEKLIKVMSVIPGDDHERNMAKVIEMARRRSTTSEGLILLLLAVSVTKEGKSDVVRYPEYREIFNLHDAKEAALDYGLYAGRTAEDEFAGGHVFDKGELIAQIDYYGEVTDPLGHPLHID